MVIDDLWWVKNYGSGLCLYRLQNFHVQSSQFFYLVGGLSRRTHYFYCYVPKYHSRKSTLVH